MTGRPSALTTISSAPIDTTPATEICAQAAYGAMVQVIYHVYGESLTAEQLERACADAAQCAAIALRNPLGVCPVQTAARLGVASGLRLAVSAFGLAPVADLHHIEFASPAGSDYPHTPA